MRRHITWRTWIFGVLSLVWLAMVFGLAGMDGVSSGHLSLRIAELVMRFIGRFGAKLETVHHIVRKVAHFGVFAVEGFLVAGTFLTFMRTRCALCVTLPLCAVFAVLNEYTQTFAEGRACSPVDMLIDFAGSALGAAVCAWLFHIVDRSRRNRRRRKKRKHR